MLSEGAIIQNFMLTRLLSKTPLSCLFQSIDVDTGERYLTRVARTEWLDQPGTIQSLGFDFRPGQAVAWKPNPGELLYVETEFLKQVKGYDLPLPVPVVCDELDDVTFVTYKFFEGVTLDEVFESGSGFTIDILITLLEAVDKLSRSGVFHGNLQPSTILVGADSVLLTDISQPLTVISGRQAGRLLRCITVPEFYPFLDPRHDELALGILLYTLVTGKHPLALEDFALRLDFARRAGPRLSELIDDARERGANRFLSPLLSFLNPIDVKRGASEDFQELVLRTLGFSRIDPDNDGGMVEVLPDTWLDCLLDGQDRSRESLWTLADTADALAQVFSLRQPAISQQKREKSPASRKQTGRTKKDKTDQPEREELEITDLPIPQPKQNESISFAPEDEEETELADQDETEVKDEDETEADDEVETRPTPGYDDEEADLQVIAPTGGKKEKPTLQPPDDDDEDDDEDDLDQDEVPELPDEDEIKAEEEEEEEDDDDDDGDEQRPVYAAVTNDAEDEEPEKANKDADSEEVEADLSQSTAKSAETGKTDESARKDDDEDSELALVSELLAETLLGLDESNKPESNDPSQKDK